MSDKSVACYIAMKAAACLLVVAAIYMEQHKIEYWGWVLFAGIIGIL